jgi:hypothetical protein
VTRELLLPILAIVILVNVGVITYVIGHHRAHELEPSWQDSEVPRTGPRGAAPSPPMCPARLQQAPAPGGETGPPSGQGGRAFRRRLRGATRPSARESAPPDPASRLP